MDAETSKSMRLAMLATAASFVVSLVAYASMAAYSPIFTYADYDNFIRVLIVAMMIQFIVMPVLLTFFVNDSGELENFTRKGPLEKAWLVNSIGVLAMIIAGVLLGLAMAEFYTGWNAPVDPGLVFGPALITMTWGMFVQSLGFGIPVFYFLISKMLAREAIPFKKDEQNSDKIGIIFAMLLILPPAALVMSPVFGTLVSGILGIVANAVGVTWMVLYFLAIKHRDLPDIPEDTD
jgi:hypothetical protein